MRAELTAALYIFRTRSESEACHETSCRSFKGAEFGPLLRPQLLDAAGLQLEVLVELLQRQATGCYGQLWVTAGRV